MGPICRWAVESNISDYSHSLQVCEIPSAAAMNRKTPPTTPPLHHAAVPAPSAWLVPPQAFPLDTSKSSPWLAVTRLSRSCWTNLQWVRMLASDTSLYSCPAGQSIRLPTGLCVWMHHGIYGGGTWRHCQLVDIMKHLFINVTWTADCRQCRYLKETESFIIKRGRICVLIAVMSRAKQRQFFYEWVLSELFNLSCPLPLSRCHSQTTQ